MVYAQKVVVINEWNQKIKRGMPGRKIASKQPNSKLGKMEKKRVGKIWNERKRATRKLLLVRMLFCWVPKEKKGFGKNL